MVIVDINAHRTFHSTVDNSTHACQSNIAQEGDPDFFLHFNCDFAHDMSLSVPFIKYQLPTISVFVRGKAVFP